MKKKTFVLLLIPPIYKEQKKEEVEKGGLCDRVRVIYIYIYMS